MRYLVIIIGLFLFSALSSCERDFLDKSPLDKISDNDVWKDPALITAFVTSKYKGLRHGFIYGIWTSSCTDESFIGADNLAYIDGSLSPENPGPQNTWFNDYSFIRNCNLFMEKIEEAPVDGALKTRLIGEIKFIRAFIYARLIKTYGGVPLILKTFQSADDFAVTRASYDECVDFIVDELDEAADILKSYPMTGKDVGRATQGAALALKSRVLLYAASVLNNPSMSTDKWQKAAEAAKAVIDLGQYSLVDNYSDIWNEKMNAEVIMARYFEAKNFEQQIDLENQPNGYLGWGGNGPTQNLVDDYETTNGLLPRNDPSYDPQNPYINRDPRLANSILYNGSPWKGRAVEPWLPNGLDSKDGINPWCASQTGGYYIKKFMLEIDPVYYAVTGDQAWNFFRLGEIYLNYAEALFHVGDEDGARTYLNKIRSRPSVDMPPVTESGDALYARIKNERRVELAFEEHRFWDVRRWKINSVIGNQPVRGVNVVKNSDGTFTYNYYDVFTTVAFQEHMNVLPIPRSEIERAPSLAQNPGYN